PPTHLTREGFVYPLVPFPVGRRFGSVRVIILAGVCVLARTGFAGASHASGTSRRPRPARSAPATHSMKWGRRTEALREDNFERKRTLSDYASMYPAVRWRGTHSVRFDGLLAQLGRTTRSWRSGRVMRWRCASTSTADRARSSPAWSR